MKTRLLKRLRRKAKNEVYLYIYIYIYKSVSKNEYRIYGYYTYDNFEEAKMKLSKCRRDYILSIIGQMRLNRENKQLRKL